MDSKNSFSALKFIRFFCILLVIFLSLIGCTNSDTNKLIYTQFDLNGAESALIQFEHTSLLIDCGYDYSFFDISIELDKRNIQKLDYFILTHPHQDHSGCATKIIQHYSPAFIILPKTATFLNSFDDIKKVATKHGIQVLELGATDQLSFGPLIVNILAPHNEIYALTNNHSLVMKLNYKDTSFLLAGDAELISEFEIMNSAYNLNSDVLKVAHHGSISSTSTEFANAVSPSIAILSVPHDNPKAPNAETISILKQNGASIFRTDKHGNITVITDGLTLEVTTEK